MTAQTVRPRRLEAAERRREIIDVGMRLIAERGYRGVSFDHIADACGITRQGVLHHFASKAELLVAILEHRDEIDAAESSAHAPFSRTLAGFREEIKALARRNVANPGVVQLYAVLSTEALEPDHPANEYFRRRLAWSRQLLREAASPWHSDPDGFAIQCLAFMEGLQVLWLRDPTIDFEGQALRFVDQILVDYV